jgi:predicted lipoprotein with Yx(FWY)xxD motif
MPIAFAMLCAAGAAQAADPAAMRDGVLAAPNGMTLYTFDADEDGASACAARCAETWPPYAAPRDATASGAFSIIERADGARQYAYRGKPLYYWSGDGGPGEAKGDGYAGKWHAVK